MGLFEQFPYTNFHEMNLDWILQEMKKLALKTDNIETAFNDLKNYVDEYFDDLNITAELKTILDQMVLDGSFGIILSDYVNQYIEAPVNMETYVNDAGQDTRVYWKLIPASYTPVLYNVAGLEYAEKIAYDNAVSIGINAGRFKTDGTEQPRGYLNVNGVTLNGNDAPSPSRGTLGFKNGQLYDMPISMTTAQMDATDPEWACTGMACLMENGVQKNMDYDPDRHPRAWIVQNVDGSYILATCEGRSYWTGGFSLQDIVACSVGFGYSPDFIYNLDGGGSCSLIDHNIRQNELIRNEHRTVKNIIGFKKTNAMKTDAVEVGTSANIPVINNMQSQPFDNADIAMVSVGSPKYITFSNYSDTESAGHETVANIVVDPDGFKLQRINSWAAGPGTFYDVIMAHNEIYKLFNRERMVPAKLAFLTNADDDYTDNTPTGLDSGFYQCNITTSAAAAALGLSSYDYGRALMITFNTVVHFDILMTRVNLWFRIGTGAWKQVQLV